MKLYRVLNTEGCYSAADQDTLHCDTLKRAHDDAKARPKHREPHVTHVEYATDQNGVLGLLNGTQQPHVWREWKLTARGGLCEVKVGTDDPIKGIL